VTVPLDRNVVGAVCIRQMRGAFTGLVFAAALLGPGLPILKRLSLTREEQLATLPALSIGLIYLVSFGAFSVGWLAQSCVPVGAACLGMCVVQRRDLARLFRENSFLVVLYGTYVCWVALHLAIIRNYSGGGWAGDWLEHYQRTLLFKGYLELDTLFFGRYLLPSRPPLMNVVCAFFMGSRQDSFLAYQVLAALLNSTVFFGAALLSSLLPGPRRKTLVLLLALLMLNPVVMQNATYVWTRGLANYFILLSVYFYARSLGASSAARRPLAFALIALGVATHYSAVPYAVALALHVVWTCRRAREWQAILGAVLLPTVILGPWFGWSVSHFGFVGTFGSNTTVTDSQRYSGGENLLKVMVNLWNTLVPHFLRGVDFSPFAQTSSWGWLRDYCFLIYQCNLPLGLGVVTGMVASYHVIRSHVWPFVRLRQGSFWLYFVALTVLLGTVVLGAKDDFGAAHACLQPIVFLGLVYAAGFLPTWPLLVQRLVLGGLAVDYLLGVFLQSEIESRPTVGMLSQFAQGNGRLKEYFDLGFAGDICVSVRGVLTSLVLVGSALALWTIRVGAEDCKRRGRSLEAREP